MASPLVPTLGATMEAGPLLEALLLSFGGLFADPVGLPPSVRMTTVFCTSPTPS